MSNIEEQVKQNLNEDHTTVAMSLKELDGLPKNIINGLKVVEGKEKTHRYFTMKKNILETAMRLIKSSDARKKIAEAKERIQMDNNGPLLTRMVDLRTRIAAMLGYKSFSEYAIDGLMAERPAVVENFLDSLYDKVHDQQKKERQELTQFMQTETNNQTAALNAWDMPYYSNLYKKKYD